MNSILDNLNPDYILARALVADPDLLADLERVAAERKIAPSQAALCLIHLGFTGKTLKGAQACIRKWVSPKPVKAQAEGTSNGTWSVGQGVTVCRYSDQHSFTVIRVTPTTITLQRDKATLLNGPSSGEADALVVTPGGFSAHTSGQQRWKCERNPNGATTKAHVNKRGEWHTNGNHGRVFDGRDEHYDYNF